MRKHPWPDGDTMTVDCPSCRASCSVQIAVVREADMAWRPDECDSCCAQFELMADGTTQLLSAPPKATTARGRALLKAFEGMVFDPLEP
ncbi:hypothetical protein QEM33_004583 [Pseudomonas putida]|nr:hypothetical protein [Pseudomonas putida]